MPILLVLAFICFVLASISLPKKPGRINFVALGLAFLVAAQLWPRAGTL